jgi:ADP-ribose pyrophosphatase YjhB (NUDIX family)
MQNGSILDLAKRIRTISEIGLLYSATGYDEERYAELKYLSEQLMDATHHFAPHAASDLFDPTVDYPTPKVDIRALVLNSEQEILMVQEKSDSCWSLPGGWAEIGHTPSEVAVKEVLEETGLHVECYSLAAVFDKRMHQHPPEPYYVYKMVFYCRIKDSSPVTLKPAFDVLDAGWFKIDALPPLSENRILPSQVTTVYNNIIQNNFLTIFD